MSEEDVICDLAETYNLFNFEMMPPYKVAIFVCGLRDDSRIKMRFSNSKIDTNRLLLAMAVDCLSNLVYSKTEDAKNGINRPKRITDILLGKEKNEDEVISFSSGEDFLKAWND